MQKIIAPFDTISAQNNTIFYNIVGNFIPPEWRVLPSNEGKVLSKSARQLLSLIVSCLHTPNANNPKIKELQESYYYFEKALGVCQRRIRQCLLELEQSGYISVTLNTVIKQYTKCRNTLCIKLLRKFSPHQKNISAEPEKNFGLTRNNFPPLHIIDKNKSIYKSRYEKSDLKKNNSGEKDKRDSDNQPPPNSSTTTESDSGLVSKTIEKVKQWCGVKKAEDFYPLTEEDAELLRLRSGRDFNLSFINKLLLKLAKCQSHNRFAAKECLLKYMVKALANEMRSPLLANNEGFNFEVEPVVKQREEYLGRIENSKDTGLQAQLEKKVAAIFELTIAYDELLKNCKLPEVITEEYQLKLRNGIELPERIKQTLLRQIQSVYGNEVKRLRILPFRQYLPPKKAEMSDDKYLNSLLPSLDPIWFRIRKYLIGLYGTNVDKAWFSKLELVKKDETANRITLKAETNFIDNWVNNNYGQALRAAFENFNYSYELIRA